MMKTLEEITDLGTDAQERYYISFAGGGAKGLVHIGALKFLERHREINIAGVSGTSAGALIAALYAVGYTADEIASKDGSSTLLSDIRETEYAKRNGLDRISKVSELFDKDAFAAIKIFRSSLPMPLKVTFGLAKFRGCASIMARGFILTLIALALGAATASYVAGSSKAFHGALVLGTISGFLFSATSLWLMLVSIRGGIRKSLDSLSHALLNGVSNIEVFKEIFSETLSKKVHGDITKEVTFSDLPHLSIVASEIVDGEAIIFSNKTSPSTSVADALCASMAIPGLFGIQYIGQKCFYDGGVVSNLPAWIFDDEKSLYPQAKVIAINISTSSQTREEKVQAMNSRNGVGKLFYMLRLTYHTMSSGGEKINIRPSNGVREFKLETDLDTTDFDAGAAVIRSAIESGEEAVSKMIDLCRNAPGAYSYLCELIRSDVVATLKLIYEELDTSVRVMKRHIRVSIALPHSGSPDLIKLKFSAGFYTFNKRLSVWSPDPDLGLILPKSRSIAGRSIEKGAHEFRELSAGGYGHLDVTKDYEIIRRLNAKTSWVYAEPLTIEVSRMGEIQQLACAISIDGDKYLLDFDKFAASKAEVSQLRNFFFTRVRQSIALNLRTISNIVGEMPSMEDCDDAHRV